MTTGPEPSPQTAPHPAQAPRQTGLRLHRPPLVTNISAARWLLLAIVAASIYFFHGFLVPVLAAMVIALASWPLRERAVARVGRTWAATSTRATCG